MKRGLAVAIALASLCFASRARAEGLEDDSDDSDQPDRPTLTIVEGGSNLVSHPITIIRPPTRPIAVNPNAVNSHVLFLNRCANGCQLTSNGPQTDNPTDSTLSPDLSDIVGQCDQGGAGGNFTLTKFKDGDAKWGQVVSCMKQIMSPFGVTVTDVDPGSAPHFEAMIGGNPGDIGCSNQVAGIADGLCQSPGNCVAPYYPNAVVFSFANVWQGSVNDICGTAAQEIAHAWGLDHTTDASNPMTYKNYTATLSFKNNEPCGSDCVNGKAPLGEACTGDGLTGTHVCNENNQAKQNELDIITGLFGPSGAKAPTVALTSPSNGSTVQPGFKISVTCTSTDSATIQEVDVNIDGRQDKVLVAPPYSYNAPTGLTKASHKIDATCVTSSSQSATASATITVGDGCTVASDCPKSTDLCVEGGCVAGSGEPGGLGSTCTGNADCSSAMCLSDGTNQHCVVPCDMAVAGACPSGFGCIDGGGTGVCWPGADSGGGGGGGCDTGGGSTGPIVLGLGFAAFIFTRKRK